MYKRLNLDLFFLKLLNKQQKAVIKGIHTMTYLLPVSHFHGFKKLLLLRDEIFKFHCLSIILYEK